LGCLSLVGCPAEPPASSSRCLELASDDGAAVARVGDVALTVEQIVQRLRDQGSGAVRRYASREKLRDFVEDQIRFELLVRAGLERGLDRDPEVIQAARKVMVRKLLQKDLGPTVFEGKVSEERIRRYYDAHVDDYQQPEKRGFAHIQLEPSEAGRAVAQNILEKVRARPSDEKLFRAQVQRHTQDKESRARAGEVPFTSRNELTEELGPSFATEVFRAPPGTLADEPVQSTRGWHVVKVVSRREALRRSLDEVRDDIRERLLKGRRSAHFDEYLSELKQRHPVALYEERLDEVLARMSGEVESP
jgi:peptidyl-prolyl cis-trans isomerase C